MGKNEIKKTKKKVIWEGQGLGVHEIDLRGGGTDTSQLRKGGRIMQERKVTYKSLVKSLLSP